MTLAKVTSLVTGAESIRWTAAAQEAKEILEFSTILKICSNALQWAGLACLPKPDFNNKLSTKMQNLHILFSSIRLFTIFFDNFVDDLAVLVDLLIVVRGEPVAGQEVRHQQLHFRHFGNFTPI